MITRVKIDGYKSFRDFELPMKPLMVIFGPNASGKSNLLDALQLISLIGTEKDLESAFDKHRGLPWESVTKNKRLDGANGPSIIEFELDIVFSESIIGRVNDQLRLYNIQTGKHVRSFSKPLRYNLDLMIDESERQVEIKRERLLPISKRGEERGKSIFTVMADHDNESHDDMKDAIYKDDSSYAFDDDRSYLSLFNSLKALHEDTTQIFPFYFDLNNWCFYYLDPKQLMREDSRIKDVDRISSNGGELSAFLDILRRRYPRQFDELSRTMNLLVPEVKELDIIPIEPDKKVRVVLRDHHGDYNYSPTLMSEGTLRALGILAVYHSINQPSLVVFEEPENGVHPARLKLIADIFRNMAEKRDVQVVLLTHSPDFVSYFKPRECYICSKAEGFTQIKPLTEIVPSFRRNLIKKTLSDLRS